MSGVSAVADLVGDRRAGRIIPHADALARSVHLRALIIPSASRRCAWKKYFWEKLYFRIETATALTARLGHDGLPGPRAFIAFGDRV